MNAKTSLNHRGLPLAQPLKQRAVLEQPSQRPSFDLRIKEREPDGLRAGNVEILQLNLGKLCNMTCAHCHVDAGPDRREIMPWSLIESSLALLERHPSIQTLDLTGGAPEMNPHFRDLVRAAVAMGRDVIDRCNLTILLAPGYEDLPQFLADQRVEIVASLPCYLEDNTDAQRGTGAHAKSIQALRRLNELGYGQPDSGRKLTLVYNPVGPQLPPPQGPLEAAYHEQLRDRYGVVFNRLFTITNMPVSRYLDHLIQTGQYETYLQQLIDAYNPASLDGLMCRNTLSVSWDGRFYDCDFNQMLDLEIEPSQENAAVSDMELSARAEFIRNLDLGQLVGRAIQTGQHCYGCTAGEGSSCQGSIVSDGDSR